MAATVLAMSAESSVLEPGGELLERGRGRTESDCHPEERSDERVPAKRVLLFVDKQIPRCARGSSAEVCVKGGFWV